MTMKKQLKQLKQLTLCLLFASLSIISYAQIRLPKLIGNGMVLQRNTALKIWGWASPNEKVKIDLIPQELPLKLSMMTHYVFFPNCLLMHHSL